MPPEKVVADLKQSIFLLTATDFALPIGAPVRPWCSGTAFLVNGEGFLITNAHVVRNAETQCHVDHQRNHLQAHLWDESYLDCSQHLLEQMIEERLNSSFHHAKVAVATFEHAIELFLKGAIAKAGQPVLTNHNAAHLLREYRRLFQGNEFEFAGKIDEAVSEQASAPRNQFARYPQDREGRPWKGHTHIDLSIWYQQLRLFKADFDRLQPLVEAKYPQIDNEQRQKGP